MARTTVFSEQELTFSVSGSFGSVELSPAPFVLTEGETYLLALDGVEHECICDTSIQSLPGIRYIPGYGVDGDPTVGSCYVVYAAPEVSGTEGGMVVMSYISDTTEDTEVHTLAIYQGAETSGGSEGEYLIQGSTLTAIANAIREKTGGTGKLMPTEFPDAILGITTGGGSSADVRYVTFMNHDGTVEYGRKAVAVGDDCADPIARGVFTTPTRESDAQYSYTFYGWANEANGAADADWSKSITENKIVYANFAAAVRYYTITYFDSDGTTVLKTESLPYGATPSYTPTKTEDMFAGWTPEPVPVTEDAAYVSSWTPKPQFSTLSWEEIAQICDAGNAASAFNIGDTKTITLPQLRYNGEIYSKYDIEFQIVGFNVEDREDGTKAAITIASSYPLYYYFLGAADQADMKIRLTGYAESDLRNDLNELLFAQLPQDLQDVIKPVKKISNSMASTSEAANVTTVDKLWIPSLTEYGLTSSQTAPNQGYYYPRLYDIRISPAIGNLGAVVGDEAQDEQTNARHGTRSCANTTSYQMIVRFDGAVTTDAIVNCARLCFCI